MRKYISDEQPNTKVTGLSINRFGRITQIRVRIDHPKHEQVKVLFSNPNPVNPMIDKFKRIEA